MNSYYILVVLSFLIVLLQISEVLSLQCVSCTSQLYDQNRTNSCFNRTVGPGDPCEGHKSCSFIYDTKNEVLNRGCSEWNVCQAYKDMKGFICKTCNNTDFCLPSSGYKTHFTLGPIIASFIFVFLRNFN